MDEKQEERPFWTVEVNSVFESDLALVRDILGVYFPEWRSTGANSFEAKALSREAVDAFVEAVGTSGLSLAYNVTPPELGLLDEVEAPGWAPAAFIFISFLVGLLLGLVLPW